MQEKSALDLARFSGRGYSRLPPFWGRLGLRDGFPYYMEGRRQGSKCESILDLGTGFPTRIGETHVSASEEPDGYSASLSASDQDGGIPRRGKSALAEVADDDGADGCAAQGEDSL